MSSDMTSFTIIYFLEDKEKTTSSEFLPNIPTDFKQMICRYQQYVFLILEDGGDVKRSLTEGKYVLL